MCNGQILSIQQNTALFALLGTMYGGDGIRTFALPNLQGRVPLHVGQHPGGSNYVQGQQAGEANHTLITSEIPAHTHTVKAASGLATLLAATNNFWAQTTYNSYSTTPNATMSPSAISSIGGSQPHNNLPPYLTLTFCMALIGIFPSRT
jgi:microcystin-dependent protein